MMARAFVIRPFGVDKKDSAGKVLNFERVHTDLIGPALTAADLDGSTTGEIVDAGNIREDMFSLILEADLVICDVTIHNANVFYELGIRHALRKRRTVLIKGEKVADNVPFDLLTDRYCAYDIDDPKVALPKLIEMVRATLQSDRETDSPIFKMLPTLSEADPTDVLVVPLDFSEEVERASVVQSKGWLRLLAEDVVGRRFQWVGLKMIAKALWDVNDFEGARDSYERVREMYPDDGDANFALANLYERLYRKMKDPALLLKSDQAIERVLVGSDLPANQRAEALALKGRNQKTRWRIEFASHGTVEERREAAMNEALRKSYEAYRDAFHQDLNHFYSGLNALQMGTIFLELSKEEDGTWPTTFDDDDQAKLYRMKIATAVAELKTLVRASVEAGLKRLSPKDDARVWAEVSPADVLFLTEDNGTRVVNKYKAGVPKGKPFVWDAAKGQLELFASLGIREELAHKVITEIEAWLQQQEGKKQEVEEAKEEAHEEVKKPLHLLLFAGHRLDSPGRKERRFPPDRADKARQLIQEALAKFGDKYSFVGMASAAPGADILFHELCAELKIPSTLCLPMPAEDYARESFEDFDDWRSRYLNLMQAGRPTLALSDRAGLPKWLDGADTNPWERGNRWVMQMARTFGAEQITLIALWDGKDEGDGPGGTADMVELARKAGVVHVNVIDAKKLLE
jgi:hypothetical protein